MKPKTKNLGKLTTFGLYRQPPSARPAVQSLKRAVKKASETKDTAKIVSAIARVQARTVVRDMEVPMMSPKVALIVAADAILRADKKVGKAVKHNGKAVGQCYRHKRVKSDTPPAPRKRWALYPVSKNGKEGKIPLYVAGTQREAEIYKGQFAAMTKTVIREYFGEVKNAKKD